MMSISPLNLQGSAVDRQREERYPAAAEDDPLLERVLRPLRHLRLRLRPRGVRREAVRRLGLLRHQGEWCTATSYSTIKPDISAIPLILPQLALQIFATWGPVFSLPLPVLCLPPSIYRTGTFCRAWTSSTPSSSTSAGCPTTGRRRGARNRGKSGSFVVALYFIHLFT